ncbi:MAG TPA: hypothetical protein VFU89_07945 [Rhabdochlamydiaceae bacterium]|nr:hypothetical protein [Rhabdochlamydiaceae bacterium]
MSTATTPVTFAKVPVPSYFLHTKRSLPERISTVAGERLVPSLSRDSDKTVKLVGEQPPRYDLLFNLVKAYEFLETEENEKAEMIFREILNRQELVDLGKDSLLATHCLLGITYATSDSETTMKSESIVQAMRALTAVKDNTANWNGLDDGQKSKAFLELRTCYRLLLPLFDPLYNQKDISEINFQITQCTKQILPIDLFNDRVREADRCVQRLEPSNARRLYKQALQMEVGSDVVSSLGAISCKLRYASTLSDNSSERVDFLRQVETKLNDLFSIRDTCHK